MGHENCTDLSLLSLNGFRRRGSIKEQERASQFHPNLRDRHKQEVFSCCLYPHLLSARQSIVENKVAYICLFHLVGGELRGSCLQQPRGSSLTA